MLPYQLAAACLQFMLSTYIIHNLRLALLHFIIFATYLKSWHSQKKADKFYFRPSHAPGNKQLAELATHLLTLLPCTRGGGGRQGVPCELGDIYANCLLCASFRINKSRVLYIYTGNVQITPQGLGEVESSSPQHAQQSPWRCRSRHCCGRRCHLRRAQFLLSFLLFFSVFFSSTNYIAKKIYLTFPLQ